jgi:hypothetical protein
VIALLVILLIIALACASCLICWSRIKVWLRKCCAIAAADDDDDEEEQKRKKPLPTVIVQYASVATKAPTVNEVEMVRATPALPQQTAAPVLVLVPCALYVEPVAPAAPPPPYDDLPDAVPITHHPNGV